MSYTAKDIRNIALLGHGGDGKTMLAEDMLFMTHGSDRLGSIADGNTVSDFDPEEIKRQYSISTSLIPVEFEGCKINLLLYQLLWLLPNLLITGLVGKT